MIDRLPFKVTTQRGGRLFHPRLQAGSHRPGERRISGSRTRTRSMMSQDVTAVEQSQSSRRLLGCSAVLAYGIQFVIYLVTWMAAFLPSWISNWMKWCPTSDALLEAAETKILSYLASPHELRFVDVGTGYGWKEANRIRMLSVNADGSDKRLPLVLLHGFASGLGLWILNMDSLAADRPVYAMDLLGFGRSSRPSFSSTAMEAEYQLVQSIEAWREKVNLERFILLGHSMGGFLAASYALQYPHRVAHLILADPWGFPERPENTNHQYSMPVWVKVLTTALKPFNPLAGLRAAGPWGPRLVERFRPDLPRKFAPLIEDSDVVLQYIYHCNAQVPSGETAFKSMTAHLGWAKHPMINRMGEMREDVPISFIYGSRSWIDRQPGIQAKYIRVNSYVDVQIMPAAGHHVYADKAEQFNALVQRICRRADQEEPQHQATVGDGVAVPSGLKDDTAATSVGDPEEPLINTPIL